MFALLEHDTSTPSAAGPERHWDLIIEAPRHDRLPTWRLARDPLSTTGEIPAERIKDHRRLYLDFEGEISGGRGVVRRLDRGPATIEQLEGAGLVVVLEGQHLRGRFEVVPDRQGQTVLRRSSRQ